MGLRKHRNAFFCQKFIDGDYCVTWGVVMVQHPSACSAWSHTCHPFPESFKDFPIKSLIDNLSQWHKFLVNDPLTVKKTNEHRFDFGFAHSRFLGMGRVCSVPFPTLAFCLRLAFCSVVRFFGTILVHTFLMSKSCVKI